MLPCHGVIIRQFPFRRMCLRCRLQNVVEASLKQTLQWCHNERDGVSNHRSLDHLLNRLFRRRSKKTSKLRVSGLCEGNPPMTGGFPSQRVGDAKMFPFDDVIPMILLTVSCHTNLAVTSFVSPLTGQFTLQCDMLLIATHSSQAHTKKQTPERIQNGPCHLSLELIPNTPCHVTKDRHLIWRAIFKWVSDTWLKVAALEWLISAYR